MDKQRRVSSLKFESYAGVKLLTPGTAVECSNVNTQNMSHRSPKNLITNFDDFPVTVSVRVRRMFGGRMSSLRTFDSVANGNPLSSISSNN